MTSGSYISERTLSAGLKTPKLSIRDPLGRAVKLVEVPYGPSGVVFSTTESGQHWPHAIRKVSLFVRQGDLVEQWL